MQWREANRHRQRQTTEYRGLVPTPPPPPLDPLMVRPHYTQWEKEWVDMVCTSVTRETPQQMPPGEEQTTVRGSCEQPNEPWKATGPGERLLICPDCFFILQGVQDGRKGGDGGHNWSHAKGPINTEICGRQS